MGASFSNYSKGSIHPCRDPEFFKVKWGDVEAFLDEVGRGGLGAEIQTMRSSKGRVFRTEKAQRKSSEAETNLAVRNGRKGWRGRSWQTGGASTCT